MVPSHTVEILFRSDVVLHFRRCCHGYTMPILMFVPIFTQEGDTPLHIACSRGYVDVVELFLGDNRVDVNNANKVSVILSGVISGENPVG